MTGRTALDLSGVAPGIESLLGTEIEMVATYLSGAMNPGGAFGAFVFMGRPSDSDYDIVLVPGEMLRPLLPEPFSYMHTFMCAPNVFAIMGVAAGVPPRGPLPQGQAMLQIEHENGTSLRIAAPYQVVSPGKLEFGDPAAFRVPPDWPKWRTRAASPND
jgi:hypothetical protein